MNRRKPLPLGGCLLPAFCFLGISAAGLSFSISGLLLLWHGVTTQGVITSVETVSCGRSRPTGQVFSVQFTDRTGQGYTSTFSSCVYGIPSNTSPGSSITIVYNPDDPARIAPPDGLLANAQLGQTELIGTILFGLITLILLPFWIRKQIREYSQSRSTIPSRML